MPPPVWADEHSSIVWVFNHSVGSSDSKWQEKTSSGITHVKENGRLFSTTSTLMALHPDFDLNLRFDRLWGDRLYEGVTNQGVGAVSLSGIGNSAWGLSIFKNSAPAWDIGFGFERVTLYRDIQSTESALGYPEMYRYNLGKLGVRHRAILSPGLNLHTSLWIGHSLNGRMLLKLPGFDPARVALGSGTSVEIGWRLIKSFPDTKWHVVLGIGYKEDVFKAGDAVTLFKVGRIAGSARQPAWRHTATHVSAEIGCRF